MTVIAKRKGRYRPITIKRARDALRDLRSYVGLDRGRTVTPHTVAVATHLESLGALLFAPDTMAPKKRRVVRR